MGPTPPPLPQGPGQIQAQLGHQGGQPMAQPGTQGFQQSTAQQVSEGVNKFMQNYFATKTGLQEHYKAKFTDAMQNIQSGLLNPSNADLEKIMKWGQKADLPLRTEAPNAHEKWAAQQAAYEVQQGQQAQAAQNVAGAASQPMLPGIDSSGPQGMSGAMQSMLTGGGLPQQQAPQGAQPPVQGPSLMQRMGLSRPPVSMESPAAQQLQQYAQAAQSLAPMNPKNMMEKAQEGDLDHAFKVLSGNFRNTTGMDMMQMGADKEKMLLQQFKKATGGDSQATELMVRSGLFKEMSLDGMDALIRRTHPELDEGEARGLAGKITFMNQVGLPYAQHRAEAISKLTPRFADNPLGMPAGKAAQAYFDASMNGQESPIQPGLTTEEFKQTTDGLESMAKMYPTASVSQLNALRMGLMSGDTGLTRKAQQSIMQTPRDGTIAFQQWQQTHNMEQGRINMDMGIRQDSQSLDIARAAMSELGDQGKALQARIDKPSSDQDLAAALREMKNLVTKKGQIALPVKGKDGRSFMMPIQDPAIIEGALDHYASKLIGWERPHMAPAAGATTPGQKAGPGLSTSGAPRWIPDMQLPGQDPKNVGSPMPNLPAQSTDWMKVLDQYISQGGGVIK